jgi:hypothetical protein
MEKHILTIGEDVVESGDYIDLISKFRAQLKEYIASGERPSKEPGIWKLVVSPKIKKEIT